MRFLLRLLLLFFVVWAVLAVIRGLFATTSAARRDRPGPAGGRLVKDPICGTYIPEETALSAKNEFFCSEECRQRFLKAG